MTSLHRKIGERCGLDQPIDITAEQRKTVLTLLQRYLPNTTAWVYGSRTKWTARPQSDLDMVVFATPEQSACVSELREAFEESNLPFRVDLFVWDTVPEEFRKQIGVDHLMLVDPLERRHPSSAGEWERRRIGTLGRVVTGKTPRTAERSNFDGPYPFITIPDLDGRVLINNAGRTLSDKGAAAVRACLLPPGAVLMSCIATVGRCGITTRPSFTNQQINSVIPGAGVGSRFLYYVFTQLGHKLESTGGGGSVYTNVSKSRFSNIEVVIPDSLTEQRAIANILGTLDDKIEMNRRMNETLEAMAQALFKSWFIDFDPVRAKAALKRFATRKEQPVRPAPTYPALQESLGATDSPTQENNSWTPERARAYLDRTDPNVAALFPDTFIDSELGEMPAGWEVKALGDVVQTVKGRSYKSKELTESETALVTLKSFSRGGGYRPDGLKSFSGTYKPEQVVHPGEVVIACTDVTHAADVVGRPAIVQVASAYRTLVASLDTLIVRPIHEGMTRAFLYLLASTHRFTSHTYAHTTGTTVLHLAKEAVPAFRFAQSEVAPFVWTAKPDSISGSKPVV